MSAAGGAGSGAGAGSGPGSGTDAGSGPGSGPGSGTDAGSGAGSGSGSGSVEVRFASEDDVEFCHRLIVELAEYEREPDAVEATPELLREALFGAAPSCEALIASIDGARVGWAVFHGTYSTWHGRPGLWLEDFYVQPRARGAGVGHALFCSVARVAVSRGCSRMNWCALDWNELALRFYARHDAELLDGWTMLRLSGETLSAAAAMAPRVAGV